jgi:DNA primase
MTNTKITKKFIEHLKSSIDIMQFMEDCYDSDFINQKHSSWANTRCPMPNHDDSNPSFGVNSQTNTYNCFGCGATGDIIKLVQEVEGYNFLESIQRLANYAQIDVEIVDFDTKYLMKELSNTIDKYFEKEIISNYPGGLSEIEFLLAFSEKIKRYEKLAQYDSRFTNWTDEYYKQIDESLQKENFKNLKLLWKNFISQAKIKMEEIKNEQQ